MKKFLGLLMATVLLLSTFIPLNAFAANCSLTATASKSSVSVGDTFTVSVNISATDISGFSAQLKFDDSYVERIRTEHSTIYNQYVTNPSTSDIGCSAPLNSQVNLNGPLFTITFKAKKAGSVSFAITQGSASTGSNGDIDIEPTISNTSVTISNVTTTEKPNTTSPTTQPTTKPTTSGTTKPTTSATTQKSSTTTTKKETTTVKLKTIATKKETVNDGATFQLEPDSKMTGKITYSTANSTVAIVSTTGKVSTLKPGTVYITAKSSNNYEQKWLVVVKDPESTTVDMTTAIDETTQFEEVSLSEVETNEDDVFQSTIVDNNNNDAGHSKIRKIIIIIGSAAVVCVAIITAINFYSDKKKQLNAFESENTNEGANDE